VHVSTAVEQLLDMKMSTSWKTQNSFLAYTWRLPGVLSLTV